MKYFMFIKHTEDYRNRTPPAGLYEAMGQFVQESFKNGTLVDTGGLKPTKDGMRVRLSKGKLATTDGPFTETKEIVGGYAIVNAKSREHAREIGEQFMELHRVHWPEFEGECEIRPFEDMPAP
jgi:hypothetical protein